MDFNGKLLEKLLRDSFTYCLHVGKLVSGEGVYGGVHAPVKVQADVSVLPW